MLNRHLIRGNARLASKGIVGYRFGMRPFSKAHVVERSGPFEQRWDLPELKRDMLGLDDDADVDAVLNLKNSDDPIELMEIIDKEGLAKDAGSDALKVHSVTIEFVGDIVDPFSYLIKRRLDQVLRNKFDSRVKAKLHFRPAFTAIASEYFSEDSNQLEENVKQAEPLKSWLEDRYSESELNVLKKGLEEMKLSFKWDRDIVSSLYAHCLLVAAENQGGLDLQHRVLEELLISHHEQGKDINSRSVLLEIAEKHGMDVEKTSESISSDEITSLVFLHADIHHQQFVHAKPPILLMFKTSGSRAWERVFGWPSESEIECAIETLLGEFAEPKL